MSESDILSWLKIKDYLKVVKAIETSPKISSDIARAVNVPDTKCAEILKNLEKVRAIEYTGSGWKTTDLGRKVLDKYFK